MPLPKIDKPLFDIEIPSLKKKKKFRPFLVKEEKIVLMAAESDDDKDLVDACRQVINNCCADNIDIEKLASFDIEYIFVQLRRHSVNNIVELAYKDLEDEKIYKVQLDLAEVKVSYAEGHTNKIQVNDDITILMRYPTISTAEDMIEAENEMSMIDQMILNCVDVVYDKETVYDDFSKEELLDFLNDLPPPAYEKIKDFFDTMPKVRHEVSYTNSKGTERTIKIAGLRDFFMF